MKISAVLLGLGVAVTFIMIFQAVRQELNIRYLRSRTLEHAIQTRRKEEAIVELKTELMKLKDSVASANSKMDELRKKKADTEKSTKTLDDSLKACNTEKGNFENKKKEMTEALAKFKADHYDLKKKAEEDIKNLKEQVLQKEKGICAFVDTTKEEARKLCGLPEAPQ